MCSLSNSNDNNTTSCSNKRICLRGFGPESRAEIDENCHETQHKFLLTNLYNSRDDAKSEMVVLDCKDGHAYAHKWILVSGSDYFQAILSEGSIENKENSISLVDTSVEVANIVIKFVYAQDIPIPPEMTDSVMRETIFTADKMQLKGLFDKFWNKYCNPLTVDKFLNVWQIAEMLNQYETINAVQIFIIMNMKQISETDRISDITLTQLESLVPKVKPNKFVKFVIFLLNWETKTHNERENSAEVVLDLLSKWGMDKVVDHSLQKLLSTEIVKKSVCLFDALSKEVTSRATAKWLASYAGEIEIFAFEVNAEQLEHTVALLSEKEWLPGLDSLDLLDNELPIDYLPTVSSSGHVFYFYMFDDRLGFGVIEGETDVEFKTEERAVVLDKITSETANRNNIFFRHSHKVYSCFNYELRWWRTIDFDEHINDCKCMLSATGDKFFFDVDEQRMKIWHQRLSYWTIREKLPGNWKNIRCKILNTNSAEKLIFFQKQPESCLLLYDIEYDSWSVVSAPDITGDVVMYVSYDDDCLVFEKRDKLYNIYSLETMRVVKQYVIEENFEGYIYFDAAFKSVA